MRAKIKETTTVAEPTVKILAYGGTAATYSRYTPMGEPFKENKTHYININYNGTAKKVRWYSGKEYHDAYKWHTIIPKKPLWSHFLFESANDKILVAKDKADYLDDYTAEYRAAMHAAGWTFRTFFGGAWLGKIGSEIPKGIGLLPEVCTWAELKEDGQKQSDKLGYHKNGEGIWYEED